MAGPARLPLGRIFGIPGLIAIISLAGLVSGLLGDGPFDVAAWFGLMVPVAAIAWGLVRRRA